MADLDSIYHNRYRGDAARLGAWKTASHVEHSPRPPKDDVPADPPKPWPGA